jgi:SAM-dependent methyltransferase
MKELIVGAGYARNRRLRFEGDGGKDFVNPIFLDINPACNPDVVWDLNKLPLPFPDNEFDEIHAYSILEHIGTQGDYVSFLKLFEEFWRITKPNGMFFGIVPKWDSFWALGDPGHTRIINEGTLVFLNQDEYVRQCALGTETSMSDYRHVYKGNFKKVAAFNHDEQHMFGFVLVAVKPK